VTETDPLRALVPAFSLVVAIVAVATDPEPGADLVFAAIPVIAYAAWAYLPGRVPLAVLAVAVLVPIVLAQRHGQLEPLLFDASLLAFVAGRWATTAAASVALGLLVVAAPVVASVLQDPSEIVVGVWVLAMVFPWTVGRGMAHQRGLMDQLEATRAELARQAVIEERRQIARDVHDSVGHGVAALMLQVTSARHVLRRDPAAAEEALRSAEEVGRRSMQELRNTVALLRRDGEEGLAPPPPSARDIQTLVDDARGGGLDLELRVSGELASLDPAVSLALYRIAQEALGNAARHAPRAPTVLRIDVTGERALLEAETTGVAAPNGVRPGYGIVGMRERATALGGHLAAGPGGGGWLVSCELPLAPEAGAP
jgi:signal transduction histidine kinase